MRNFLMVSSVALGLSACANSDAGSGACRCCSGRACGFRVIPAAPAPQCWNGDAGSFMAVGTQAEISGGRKVTCEKTADVGKNAQWMGKTLI